ncbi:MAG: hypothetical protein GY711_33725 [bacterium]|nr:hypothetical protein [bacterium]
MLTALAPLLLAAPATVSNDPTWDKIDAANDEGWARLDAEVEALTGTLQDDDGAALDVWGYLRTTYAASGDIDTGGNDLGGFFLDAVRINFEGSRADYGYRVDTEWFNGSSNLIQAYAGVAVSEHVWARIGQFRVPFLRTGQLEADRRLFLSPTRNAQFYATADLSRRGVMFHASHDDLNGQLAVQNGLDGQGDELMITGRVEWNAAGSGVGLVEGAWGAADGTNATIGIAASDDQSADDGLALAAEAAVTHDRASLQAEIVDYEDDYTAADLILLPGVDPLATRGDTTPYSVTASYVIDEAQTHEVAVRWEDFDDGFNRELLSLGWNHYFEGHDAKLQVNYTDLSTDNPDEQTFAVGLTLSF